LYFKNENMETVMKLKRGLPKSYRLHKVLAAIQGLTQDELISLKNELAKGSSPKKPAMKSECSEEDKTFFLFGKCPDFEDTVSLRQRAWKRNSI
jgi:hypothetical protein